MSSNPYQTVFSSQQIAQLAGMGMQQMAPPPLWPTLMQGLMYGPQTPAGLQAAQQLGPAALGMLISPQTPILGALTQGAQNRANMMGAIGQISFPGGMGPMGQGFGAQERESIYQQIRQQQVLPQATMGELAQLVGAGAQGGAFQAVRSVQDFKQKFGELLQAVRTVTTTLGTSLQESMALLQQVRSFGMFGQQGAQALAQVQGVAYATGMAPQAVMQGAAMAVPGMMQAGIRGPQAMGASLMMQRTLGTAYNMGILGPEGVFGATGMAPEAGGLQAMGGQFLGQAAQRMRRSPRGAWLTAAMLDPTTGGVDPEMMEGLRAGTLSLGELQGQASRRAGQYGQLDWTVNRGKLASNMMQAEPMADLFMYRNVLRERGVEDMTSSRGRLMLSRLTGMSMEQTEPMADILQNIDRIRMHEQVATVRSNRATAANQRWREQVGGPDFMRGFQDKLKGLIDKIEGKGEELQKTVEQLMIERLGGELDTADQWISRPIAEIMFRPGEMQRMQGFGQRYAGAGGAGPRMGGAVAPGITDPQQQSMLRMQARLLDPSFYVTGATGDWRTASEEATRRREELPYWRQKEVEKLGLQQYAALEQLTGSWTGESIAGLPGGVGEQLRRARQIEEAGRGGGRMVGGAAHRQAQRMREETLGGWGMSIPGFAMQNMASVAGMEKLTDFLRTAPTQFARGGIGGRTEETLAERWKGTLGLEIGGERQEISEAGMREILGRGYSSEEEIMRAVAGKMMAGKISPEQLKKLEEQVAGLGIGGMLAGQLGKELGRAPTAGERGVAGMFAQGGGEWSMSKIRGFLRATEDISGKMYELTEKEGGALFGKSADDLLSAAKGTGAQDSESLFRTALEGKGLDNDQIETLLSHGAIRESLKREGDAGVKDALNAVLNIGRGSALLSVEAYQGTIRDLFGMDPEKVEKLRARAGGDRSLGPLVSAIEGVNADPTKIGSLVAEVYRSSDSREISKKLGALAGAGYGGTAMIAAAGGAAQRLERAGKGGPEGRKSALLDILGGAGDVSALRGKGVSAGDIASWAEEHAGLGGPGIDIRKYLETGKGLEHDVLTRKMGDLYSRMGSAQDMQDKKTAEEALTPKNIADAIGKIEWQMTFEGGKPGGPGGSDDESKGGSAIAKIGEAARTGVRPNAGTPAAFPSSASISRRGGGG